MEKFIFNKEIGRGSFGKVYLIESRRTGIQYVLKQIDISKMDKKQAKLASKEVEVLSKLIHFHIVRYKESYETNIHLNIIMEYCENGDLHRKIKEKRMKNECFMDSEIMDYFVQICLALEYIHDQKILHRDLKSKNIFLTKGNIIKLGDFGVAKVLDSSFELANTCIGSPYYISPEICENKPYNKKSDMWALGCVLYELSTLKYAFVAKNVKVLIAKISSGAFNPLPTGVNPQIRSLLVNLLKPNPKDRPTASEILKKQFLKKYILRFSPENNTHVTRRRSSSIDSSKKCMKLNNEIKILSNSCAKLNDLTTMNKITTITAPETKYMISFLNNKPKFSRKTQVANLVRKPNIGVKFAVHTDTILNNFRQGEKQDVKENMQMMDEISSEKKLGLSESSELTEADSGYYKTLTENIKAGNGRESKIESPFYHNVDSSEVSNSEYFKNKHTGKINQECYEYKGHVGEGTDNESRRRWMANTLEKNQLINILSETDLIDIPYPQTPSAMSVGEEHLRLTIDEILKLDPSEMSEDILKPIKVKEIFPVENRVRETCINHMKKEIEEIKTKFEENNKKYDLKDLIRLAENTKMILKEGMNRKSSGDENLTTDDSDSVYFDLELKRMQLEKTLGLNTFLMIHKKMTDMLNGNYQSKSLRSGTDTYVIKSELFADDCNNGTEKSWLEILEAFGPSHEYIPDIWECVVLENCYY